MEGILTKHLWNLRIKVIIKDIIYFSFGNAKTSGFMFLFPFKNNMEGENQNDSTQRKPQLGYKGERNISSESMMEFKF